MKPNIFPVSILCALSFLSLLDAAEPVVVRTSKATPAAAVAEFSAIGRTAPAQQAYLFSRATGTIAECKVDIGDRVKQGDVLATIDAPEIPHRISAAQAKIAQMSARAELAEALLKRAESITAAQAISAQELDERRASTKAAAADLFAAQAELRELEEMEKFLSIRAPFDGTIIVRRIDRGDHVNGDTNTTEAWLFHIARLDELRMILHVPPATALQIRTKQQADVSFPDIPNKPYTASVSRYSSLIEEASGSMQVELTLPNPDFAIPAGLSGNAKIKVEAPVAANLLVPANALVTRAGISQVALVESGKVKFNDIKTGRTLGPKVEILDGLKLGDDVILSPNALLKDGDPVTATLVMEPRKGG